MTTGFDDESIAEQNGDASHDSDGGGGLFGGVASAVFGLDEASAFNKQATDVKNSAENGGWAISPEGTQAYKDACDEFIDRYRDMIRKAHRLETKVKLGSSPYAASIADFNVTVANGDEQSLIPNLELMRDGYEKLKEALKIAEKHYDDNEDSVVQQLGKLTSKT